MVEKRYHISSAVVSVLPHAAEAVRAQVETIAGVEVHACEKGKIIITIEGDSTRALGDTLSRIALFDHVVSANMVFEHAQELQENPT
ncbi:chaperone NapD [Mesorhizobium xinjiangense]|uniref:chaperone NapD n=1 Tax=Mesorhizobium xinjiangense TaxID=2678685 RepID=UPI0012EEC7BE|nr:chaperone NapD [Mesorhizobium xinjiangense]